MAAVMLGGVGGYAWSSLPPAALQSTEERTPVEQSVHYSGCNEVRALGKAPLHAGEPGYRAEMDGDGDGIACEPYPRQGSGPPDATSLSRSMVRASLHARRW